MAELTPDRNSIATSAGHKMSSAAWLDAHYRACECEYEAMIRSVGIQPGWHVLDAGCGTGGFLSIIAELVGNHGEVTAIDIAPEHIDVVRTRAESDQFACSVTARVGDIRALPFQDKLFDAIWNANVAQYLNESELRMALAEFRRVLKPGGVLAIKDGDITALQIFPIPPIMLWRLLYGWAGRGDRQIIGLLESLKIDRHMRDMGFAHVTRHVTFIERMAPFRHAESQFVIGLTKFFTEVALTLDLPRADIEFWRSVSEVGSHEFILDQRDLYLREAALLALGYEPSR